MTTVIHKLVKMSHVKFSKLSKVATVSFAIFTAKHFANALEFRQQTRECFACFSRACHLPLKLRASNYLGAKQRTKSPLRPPPPSLRNTQGFRPHFSPTQDPIFSAQRRNERSAAAALEGFRPKAAQPCKRRLFRTGAEIFFRPLRLLALSLQVGRAELSAAPSAAFS